MRYFAVWTILGGIVSIFLAALASNAATKRWSDDSWDEFVVRLTLVALLISAVLSVLWFASGVIVGGPLTALAVLLWPAEATRDYDFGFIFFLPINGAAGLFLFFILFPMLYWLSTAPPLPTLVRVVSAPLISIALLFAAAGLRNTTSNIAEFPGLLLILLGEIGLPWLLYLFAIDYLAFRLVGGR